MAETTGWPFLDSRETNGRELRRCWLCTSWRSYSCIWHCDGRVCGLHRRGGHVLGSRLVRIVSLISSMPSNRWMKVIEEEGSRANVEEDGMRLTKTSNLGMMYSGSYSVLTWASVVGPLQTAIISVAYNALGWKGREVGYCVGRWEPSKWDISLIKRREASFVGSSEFVHDEGS